MQPYIFLDIDGVCQPYVTVETLLSKPRHIDNLHLRLAEKYNNEGIARLGDEDVNRIYFSFDQESMAFLKALIKEFDAQVIVTSSWTIAYSLEEFQAIFAMFGFGNAITGIIRSSAPRFQSILDYVQDHGIENYLVIDDMDMKDIFGQRQIQTWSSFQPEDYTQAVQRLQEGMSCGR